jgi:ubiquinone/menaquinone biosynthesis C-methylase UbiE
VLAKLYNDLILPRVIHLSMRNQQLLAYRRRTVSQANGRVLEIGIGSGLNLPLYGARVESVVGVEPAPRLLAIARETAASSRMPVTLIAGSAESLPIDSCSLDTVVSTWTLCSIPNVALALQEIHRTLKPGGQLLFVEHGLAPEADVRKWQHRLTPCWKRLGGGCHLDRPIDDLIEHSSLDIASITTGYAVGPKTAAFFYEGRALRPAA